MSTTLILSWSILPPRSLRQVGLDWLPARISDILISTSSSCMSPWSSLVSRVIMGKLRGQGVHDFQFSMLVSQSSESTIYKTDTRFAEVIGESFHVLCAEQLEGVRKGFT